MLDDFSFASRSARICSCALGDRFDDAFYCLDPMFSSDMGKAITASVFVIGAARFTPRYMNRKWDVIPMHGVLDHRAGFTGPDLFNEQINRRETAADFR